MHDDSALAAGRLTRFLHHVLLPATYRATAPVQVSAWRVNGEPVRFQEAVDAQYEPFAVGGRWGVPWDTVWFRIRGEVPAEWAGVPDTTPELVVDLGFDDTKAGFQAEGLLFTPEGRTLKAVSPLNRSLAVNGTVDLYLEAAANPDVAGEWTFQPTALGSKPAADAEPVYELRQLELALLDRTVWELQQDVLALSGLAAELPAGLPRRAEIVRALDRMVDAVDPDDVAGTAAAGREQLAEVLSSPAWPSSHQVVAIGHAHIDSAWLWPVRETMRKCARTFSNVLALAESHPEFRFACSSAQQLEWIRQGYPELFARIQQAAERGQFIPVGGMWVESDTNLPGGEAMARQFLEGKSFFAEHFGIEPREVWLPDSFGYSAALPQIARAAGAEYFLTQKISWNRTNVMPHHTFRWEGIDGTRIFTHFPPVDTYNSDLSARELAHAERNYRDKGQGTVSLVPFGWGDGGGGPTREMLAAARRTASLEGSPRVRIDSPQAFFEQASAEYPQAPVWSGELYLEMHRGTYTSQARTKHGNRRSESLLREAELWSATATVRTGSRYPAPELRELWQLVLLQQFHDILPGSSIAWVHREAEKNYESIRGRLERLIEDAQTALVGPAGESSEVWAFSAAPVPQPQAIERLAPPAPEEVVTRTEDGGFRLRNEHLTVELDGNGLIVSLTDHASGREAIAPGQTANRLQLHRDEPNRWDAWDVDEHYRNTVTDLIEADSVSVEGTAVTVVRTIGSGASRSSIRQQIRLAPGGHAVEISHEIDWHQRHKLLKLAFGVDVHADRFAAETQFGHVFRPTHTNTSWDAARFEVCAHRWVHVGEPGYGVAVANDASYGHDVTTQERPGGGRSTTVRVSLLRAPTFPDPEADQGVHRFTVSLRPNAGIPEAVEEGYRLNLPVRTRAVGGEVSPDRRAPLVTTVPGDGVVIEAVKLAHDGSGDVVVRLYEAYGRRTQSQLGIGFLADPPVLVDLLERPVDEGGALRVDAAGAVQIQLRPFQILTLRITPQGLPQ